MEKIDAALAGHRQFFEWTHTKLDGTPVPAEVTLNKVSLGGQVLLQAIVRDISERKRAEEQIQMLTNDLERRVEQRTAELQAANKELEAFTYSVSHDLRAPLRAVDGFARIVAKDYSDKLDAGGREMLDFIRGGAQQMGRLIDDLLAFSRLGRQALEPAPVDMHDLAQAVFDQQAALDPGRKLRLDLHPLPATRGTRAMIRQVWVNLISNAIKFTKGREVGEIEIGVRRGEAGEEVYYVKDNGAGFDMRHVGRLFGVFQRLHAMDEFEGTGVGLALVKRIVERHGGRVWAEAEVDRGATFSFTIPSPEQ
jgi:light-regulated signal transduction histidine kinase (bacteriophytochrome)